VQGLDGIPAPDLLFISFLLAIVKMTAFITGARQRASFFINHV
jgi:hypothetical protein